MTVELQSKIVDLDFETKSYADIKKVGTWAYTQHPTTDIICACYKFGDGEVIEWWPGIDVEHVGGMPHDLYMHFALGGLVRAANCPFEMGIINNLLVRKYGWAEVLPHRMRDPLRVAAYYGLPQSVDKLAKVLGFEGKDAAGGRLISKYSNLHLKTAKKDIPDDDFYSFVDYCKQDVEQQYQIGEYLGELPKKELSIFKLWLKMDLLGLGVDIPAVEDAIYLVEKRLKEVTEEFQDTFGFAPTQVAKVLEWCNERLPGDQQLENLQADTIEEVLKDKALPKPVRKALELRSKSSSASIKKLRAMQLQTSPDHRCRFQTKYHGAGTGRKTGTGIQPYNMNRGSEDADPELSISQIRLRDPEWLDMMFGDALDHVAKSTRHFIKAEKGSRLIAGDWVSIEAVVLACLAGEDWKIEAFRRGEKIYERTADMVFNLAPGTVTKATHPEERQVGKTCELAFGYQGAVGAWRKFDDSDRYTDEEVDNFKKQWRGKHPMIVRLWDELETAALRAVQEPDEGPFYYRQIGFEMVEDWLSMILPNKKRIWYWDPDVRVKMPAWHKPREIEECATGECNCSPVPQLSYMATKEGQWKRVYTYGGKLTENATQATAREVLAPAMLRLDEAGYRLILDVYDEIVAEMPYGKGSVEEFKEIMLESPGKWADDWPISVDVWEGERYKK